MLEPCRATGQWHLRIGRQCDVPMLVQHCLAKESLIMSDSPNTSLSSYDRLCVDIKGPPVVRLEDIISIRFSENLAQRNLLEVFVNNWDIGSQSYKYSEGNLLGIGASISLYSGDTILADGRIAALAPSFPEGSCLHAHVHC